MAIQPTELLFAVIDGRLAASADCGNEWQQRAVGLGSDSIDTVVLRHNSGKRKQRLDTISTDASL